MNESARRKNTPSGLSEDPSTKYTALFDRQVEAADRLRQSSVETRIRRLKKLESALLGYEDLFVDALSEDLGKHEQEVLLTEIVPVLGEIRHARRNLRHWMRPTRVATSRALIGTQAEIRHEARGPSLIIAPWNYSINLSLGPLVSAIAAGCPAIIKPSEFTPATAETLYRLVDESFPDSEIAVVTGSASTAVSLLQLPFRHIHFTGSTAVGRKIMTAAAVHLASVTLELGGRSPAIVDRTANLAHAAEAVVFGKFTNAGQTCIAPDHLWVDDSVYDAFVDHLMKAIERLHSGTAEREPAMTRIINRNHMDRLISLCEEAIEHGATAILGGNHDPDTLIFEPTLLTDVPETSRILSEEIFGPILPVLRFGTLSDLLSTLRAQPPPLTIYVFGDGGSDLVNAVAEIPAGSICINETLTHFADPELPFGGLADSGTGRSHGKAGFLSFSNPKVVQQRVYGHALIARIRPPFDTRTLRWIRRFMRFS